MHAAFRPKLATVSREGRSTSTVRADAIAGLTAVIVALPLAMVLGIVSGTSSDKGLVTAVVAGFLISALSVSRVHLGDASGKVFCAADYAKAHSLALDLIEEKSTAVRA